MLSVHRYIICGVQSQVLQQQCVCCACIHQRCSATSVLNHPAGLLIQQLSALIAEDVMCSVRALPDKQCCSDPLPIRLLKENVDMLVPFLVELLNRLLVYGTTPTGFKAAYITPWLKKPDVDQDNTKSYRPISS